MTRSRTKLLEQQVNSLLIEYDVCDYENCILPKSMHLCMIRFIDNTSIEGAMERVDEDGKHKGGGGTIQDRDSIRTARSPEFETDVDSSYGLQMKQMSTIRIGNFESFPTDPAPSLKTGVSGLETPGVSGLTPDDP